MVALYLMDIEEAVQDGGGADQQTPDQPLETARVDDSQAGETTLESFVGNASIDTANKDRHGAQPPDGAARPDQDSRERSPDKAKEANHDTAVDGNEGRRSASVLHLCIKTR